MAGLTYMEVGEKRIVDGVLVECVKDERSDTLYCGSCVFNNTDICVPPLCSPTERKDAQHVHFRRVES